MSYWQVAAGDGNREYSDIFLRYGIMLIGPGDPGEYFKNREYYENEYDYNDVKYFAEEITPGDIVVLKRPLKQQWHVLAVGRVRGAYSHCETFDDVEGWGLQHCRNVEWHKPNNELTLMKGLTRGTLKRVHKQQAIQTIDDILKKSNPITPQEIPEPVRKLTDEELIDKLISYGLRPNDAEDFTQTIRRIRRLVKWYDSEDKNVKEHETRTFLIIPLLLALGWPEQKLKIEWNNIDVAFFEKPYNDSNFHSNNCVIILESKRLGEGLTFATNQGADYAKKYSNCDRLIITDGCRYRLYKKSGSNWQYAAYLNILKQKILHPYEKTIKGAPDVFLNLMTR